MFPHPLLIADIGGTNVRFALFGHPGAEPRMLARLKTADFSTPALAINAVLADFPEAPRSAILCVAGPVVDRRCHLTNAAWTIDGPALLQELGLEQGLLLNDFEAQALSLPAHRDPWLTQIGTLGRSSQSGPRVILGPGTGLGIGALIELDNRFVPIPSESCHIEFGPVEEDEFPLWRHLERVHGRITTESVMSGPGLVRLYRARLAERNKNAPEINGSEIVNVALRDKTSFERSIVDLYVRLIGRFAGDIAITFLATGGVTLAGGILPRIAPIIHHAEFRKAFEKKAPVERLTATIPCHLLHETDAVLYGMGLIGAKPERYALDYARRLWNP
ncbi:MAG: glucokinase [Hyphomicrobiales bacterium]